MSNFCESPFLITKHFNIEILLSSIAQSTGQYFAVLVQLYWECTELIQVKEEEWTGFS